MNEIRVLHIPAIVVWTIGLAGVLNQVYGLVNFLSVWANDIVSPSQSNTFALIIHGLMFVGGIAGHLAIEKMA